MHQLDSTTNIEELAHNAANETLSISMGLEVLSTLPESALTPAQSRALSILRESSERLLDLIDAMKEELIP